MSEMSHGGPDLSYDFVTRPAYDDALLTGMPEFLRLVFQLMRNYSIDPARLIHALQNHDELTMDCALRRHADPSPSISRRTADRQQLRDLVHREMYGRLMGERAALQSEFGDGVACTTATLIAATLGLSDISTLEAADVGEIKRLHLLLAFYNAMQPGVFALSGWDLSERSPCRRRRCANSLPTAILAGSTAAPMTCWARTRERCARRRVCRAPWALYGSLPQQLKKSDSFRLAMARCSRSARSALYAGTLGRRTGSAGQRAAGAGARAAGELGLEITAINFGDRAVNEAVAIRGAAAGAKAIDSSIRKRATRRRRQPAVHLNAFEGKAWRIKG